MKCSPFCKFNFNGLLLSQNSGVLQQTFHYFDLRRGSGARKFKSADMNTLMLSTISLWFEVGVLPERILNTADHLAREIWKMKYDFILWIVALVISFGVGDCAALATAMCIWPL